MITERRKLLLGGGISIIAFAAVLYSAHFTLPDLSRAKPLWLIGVLVAQLLLLLARATTYRALASTGAKVTNLQLIQLAARHQLLFSFVPGGIGDFGFPYIAKRIAGIETAAAVRMIAQLRLRDAICVATIALAALVYLGLPRNFGFAAILFAIPAMWFADEIAISALKIIAVIAPKSRLLDFLRDAAVHEPGRAGLRAARAFPAVAVWLASIAAVLTVFRAIGFPITFGESLMFVTALNIARAISLSIAGLGVSEAGAAAALVAYGSGVRQASSIAVVVRPLLLVSMIALCAIMEAGIALLRTPYGKQLRVGRNAPPPGWRAKGKARGTLQDDQLWIVVPAYNEQPQIARTVTQLRDYLPNVIVIDDGSADSTATEARNAGAHVVRHALNLGQGAALITGIKYALRKGAEYVVTFDADGQHQPEDIQVLLRAQRSSGADAVIGSRFLGTAIDMPIARRMLLKAATIYTRLTTKLPLTDAHNGLRLLTRSAAEALRLRHNRMAHASEILEWLSASGFRVAEAPVRIRYTAYSLDKGQSFFSSFNIMWDIWSSRLHR